MSLRRYLLRRHKNKWDISTERESVTFASTFSVLVRCVVYMYEYESFRMMYIKIYKN